MPDAATLKFQNVSVGDSASVTKTISEADVYLFAGITGDFSPNHIDEVYMSKGRYGKRVAHGALLVGFMSAAIARLYVGRTVSLGYDKVRFLSPVYFGDTITTVYRVTEINEEKGRLYADLTCTNQEDKVVAVAKHVRAYLG